MNTVLRSIDQLTPEWLTYTLHQHGTLKDGSVVAFRQIDTRHMASLNFFLEIQYSSDVSDTVPRKLFLKLARPERLPLNDAEVIYYTHIAVQMPISPTPICYDAQFDPENGAYHVLLQDVSDTHAPNAFPLPPRVLHAEMMIDLMAQFHAFWWQHPCLDGELATLPTPEVIERYVSFCEAGLQPLIDFVGDRLSLSQIVTLQQVFKKHRKAMIKRAESGENLTLIHGDSHTGNFLFPLADDGRAYMIDRQPFDWSLTCWLGVSDLAYMMVHWWHPERRRMLEKPLLQRYLNKLHELGIRDYSWEQLWDDYRLCAMQSFYVAVEWCRENPAEMAWIWYPQLQNTLTAFDDLACVELLE